MVVEGSTVVDVFYSILCDRGRFSYKWEVTDMLLLVTTYGGEHVLYPGTFCVRSRTMSAVPSISAVW